MTSRAAFRSTASNPIDDPLPVISSVPYRLLSGCRSRFHNWYATRVDTR